MPDVRIINESKSGDSPIAAQVRRLARGNPLLVAQVNVSGDIVNPGGGGSGGDGAINDGADSNLKATVRDYTNANPLTVVLVNSSGDAYNANGGITVAKWNLTPAQDAVHIHSGLVGVSGDVSTTPKAGQTWPVSFGGTVGVQVVGGSIGTQMSVSGDSMPVRQQSAWAVAVSGDVSTTPKAGEVWPIRQTGTMAVAVTGDSVRTAEQNVVGVNIVGGSLGGKVSISGDTLAVTATDFDIRNLNPGQDSIRIHGGLTGVTGDVSTTPKAGETWPVSIAGTVNTQPQGVVGVQIVGGAVGAKVSASGDSLQVRQQSAWATSVTGDVRLEQSYDRIIGRIAGPLGVNVVGTTSRIPVSGDTVLVDGADVTIKGTVRDYANSNPLAVALTNVSGDTYSPGPREPITTTLSGRITSAGTTTIAGGYAGRVVKVSRYELQSESADSMMRFGSGASGDALGVRWIFGAREGALTAVSPMGGGHLFKTNLSQALVIEHFDTNPVNYSVTFHSGDAS